MRKMKDSGIPWIGKIPDNWTNGKLLYLLSEKISDGPHETPDYQNDGIPFISVDSLSDSEEINFDIVKKFITVEDYHRFCEKSVLNPGDVLFSKAATIGKTAIVPNKKFMIWSPLAILKPAKGTDSKFLYWLLSCKELVDEVKLSGSENTQINVGMRELEHINVPIIPINDQRKIAHYLDIQNNKITSFIQKQQDLIDKLTAYKQSLITETVTRGLDPSVPMKDSGIPWIGKIPEQCRIIRAGRVYKSILGKMICSYPPNQSYTLHPYICAKDVHFDEIDISDLKQMWFSAEEEKIYRLKSDDLLVVEGGAGAGGAATINFKMDRTDIYIQNSIHLIRPQKCSFDNRYFMYTIGMLVKNNYIDYVCNKATIPHFTKEKVMGIPIVLRPYAEQREIVDFLDKKCSQIDADISKRLQLIDKLKEYKKSLIYEVVTGKREVE